METKQVIRKICPHPLPAPGQINVFEVSVPLTLWLIAKVVWVVQKCRVFIIQDWYNNILASLILIFTE